jgi:carboxyl-terminal processing protease
MFKSAMLKRTLLFVAALCASLSILVHSGPSFARASSANAPDEIAATREGRLRVFDDVWETVRKRYYDPTLNGVDWSSSRQKFRQLAADAGGQPELYAAMRRMLVALRDPHTRIFAPGENADWRIQRAISIGLRVRDIGGEVVVTAVDLDSDAERAGVRVGDALIKVNGELAASIVARNIAEQSTSTLTTARSMAVSRLFEGSSNDLLAITLRSPDGREKRLALRRRIVVRAPDFRARMVHDGIGVVRFNVFSEETATSFVKVLKADLKNARSLIIDLRENGGGKSEAMTDIASLFLPAGVNLGRFTDREGKVRLAPQTRVRFFSTADEVEYFAGPILMLTDSHTASASEVFAAALRGVRRASVIGERTCGCVLGIRRRHTLPDGGVLDVSELDYRTSSGRRLEGTGLDPDERIAPTRSDIVRGRDPALARAVAILRQR